jgi:hypothetical protein
MLQWQKKKVAIHRRCDVFRLDCAICGRSWRETSRMFCGLRNVYCRKCFVSLWLALTMFFFCFLTAMIAGCGNVTPESAATIDGGNFQRRGNVDGTRTKLPGTGVDSGTVESGDSGTDSETHNPLDANEERPSLDSGLGCVSGEVYPCETGLCQCP